LDELKLEPLDNTAAADTENKDAKLIADLHLDDLLRLVAERGASDLHLAADLPPTIRIDGELVHTEYDKLTPRDIQRFIYDILTNEQIQWFEKTKELDFSYGVKGVGRFRVNVYRQRGSIGAAMRAIPSDIPSMEELGLPLILKELAKRNSGLILVTGPTGSGKSTTIATMIDTINHERKCHVMTIEDPIEYLHRHNKCMINQRELNTDTDSFNNALRAVLREDPDVILIGEMRDLETIASALTLAETGHLVFGTLHTRNAPQTIDRVVDVFPPYQQDQIKVQLSNTLEAVVAQQLIPKIGGGRFAAVELLIATPAVRNLIREGKSYQIYGTMETGGQQGMVTMDKILAEAQRKGLITHEDAENRAIDKDNFLKLLSGT
jgi:twitching motility protein PilT